MIRNPQQNFEEAHPTYNLRIKDVEPESICFVLRQIRAFYCICEKRFLPISSPIAFFGELKQQFDENTETALLKTDADDYLTLMLLYAVYGNTLFGIRDSHASELTKDIMSLQLLAEPDTFRDEIRKFRLEPVIMRYAQHGANRKVFSNGAELFYWEERNCKFSAIREHFLKVDPVNSEKIFYCSESHARGIFEIFLTYYKAIRSLLSDDAVPKKGAGCLSISELRQRLHLSLELQKIYKEYTQELLVNETVLKSYTKRLCDIIKKYPKALTAYKSLKSFLRLFSNCPSDKHKAEDFLFQLFSDKPKTDSERNAALLYLVYVSTSYPYALKPLQSQLEKQLQCYLQEPLYRFFVEAFKALKQYPDSHPYAPVYMWRLFHEYTNKLSKATNGMFSGKTAIDFSFYPLFDALCPEMLSEENRSKLNYDKVVALFDDLIQFFQEQGWPVDAPMCEYIFQRISKTQLDIHSNTSILGTKLKNYKPLHRGFALIWDAIQHMSDNQWRTMPRTEDFPVSEDAAEAFYQANIYRGNEVMKHLHEHSKTKTTLTDKQCSEIASIVLSTEECTKAECGKMLAEWMHSYINTDPILKEYADGSPENYGCLQFSIYRIALERYAHRLGRDIFDVCARLFYYPLPKHRVRKMWDSIFTECSSDWRLKRISDPTHIRSLQLPSRNFYILRSQNLTDQYYKRVSRFAQYPYILILQDNNHQSLKQILCGERCARIFFEPERIPAGPIPVFKGNSQKQEILYFEAFCNEDACLKSIQDAINLGFDGIKLSGVSIAEIDEIAAFAAYIKGRILGQNEYIVELMNIYRPYGHFIKRLRNQLGSKLPIIFTVCVPDNWNARTENNVRAICRWLADDGVDMIDLEPIHDSMPIERLAVLCDSLKEAVPIPILMGKSKLLQSPDRILQQHGITGLVSRHFIRT